MLNSYLTQVQNLLNQTNATQQKFPIATLTGYINEARIWIASKSQCVRFLPAISSGIATVTIQNAGSGYGAAPAISVSSADQTPSSQPTITATISGGAVNKVTLTAPGSGFFSPNPPTVSVSASASGTTAIIAVSLNSINQTAVNQESYNFSAVSVGSGNGIANILAVRGIATIWGNYRYSYMQTSWSKYQALVRNFTSGYTFIPAVFCQYGQGIAGSVFMYPIPNSNYQMEWDCICLPQPLTLDTDIEAIPVPWQNCVKYYAAYLALMGVGRYKDAEIMLKYYEKFMLEARAQSQVGAVSNFYGRGL